jgi:hypothetical protein
MKWTAFAAVACVALALAGCAGGTATEQAQTPAQPGTAVPVSPTGPVVMTTEQAADRYMMYICPYYAAGGAINDALQGLHVGRSLSESQKAVVKKFIRKALTSARGLQDDGYVWPAGVAENVHRVAVGLYEAAASAGKMLDSGQTSRITGGDAGAASEIRLGLGLPPGWDEGCKKYLTSNDD